LFDRPHAAHSSFACRHATPADDPLTLLTPDIPSLFSAELSLSAHCHAAAIFFR